MKIKIGNSTNNKDGTEPVKKTIEKYMNHPSISLIETALRNSEKCKIQFAIVENNKYYPKCKHEKIAGLDMISAKVISCKYNQVPCD